jgi:hypothetical protein
VGDAARTRDRRPSARSADNLTFILYVDGSRISAIRTNGAERDPWMREGRRQASGPALPASQFRTTNARLSGC